MAKRKLSIKISIKAHFYVTRTVHVIIIIINNISTNQCTE
jgi:hypothetical protein